MWYNPGMNFIKELGIPFVGFILFFIFQAKGKIGEVILTSAIIFLTAVTLLVSYHDNEWLLFLVGLSFGILIEIGLRYFGYQQVWERASFFGVPYWLPIIWGFGFIIITRLGIFILGLNL
jgi:hypothetical protein